MKKAIITGATGMLGIALIEECLAKGIAVTAVARPGSARSGRLSVSQGVSIIECGLEDMGSLPSKLSGSYDYFFHLAWAHTDREGRENSEKQNSNIGYTLEAVRAAKALGCSSFVGAGSQAEYGRVSGAISPDVGVNPDVAYGVAKFAAGKFAAELCARLGFRCVWTRIFSVYGPNDGADTMVSYCVRTLLEGGKPSLTKCEQMWDYLYCSDAANALLLSAERGIHGKVYNIGSGLARPLSEYVCELRDCIDPELPVGIGEKAYSPIQVMHLCADISSLSEDTGFCPRVSFKEGIVKTASWTRSLKK